jgi:MoaA/NifB/PqqE/SkfB family radical SAM enzyme
MSIKKYIKQFLGAGQLLRIKSAMKLLRPDSLRIDISAGCNARCLFCPREYMPESRKVGFMDLEVFKNAIDEASRYGIRKVKLYISSEPTLHPEFDTIVEICKERKMKTFVSTNASTLLRWENALSRVDVLQLSIEGWDQTSYEELRFPLKFDVIYKNVKNYCEKVNGSQQFLTIHLPMTKKTDLNKFLLLWGNFVNEVRVDFMQPANLFKGGKAYAYFKEELKAYYFDFEQHRYDYICFDPFCEITVGFDGKIMLCCLDFAGQNDLGYIQNGIKKYLGNEILRDIKNQFYKQALNVCKECSLFYRPTRNAIDRVKTQIKAFKSRENISAKIVFEFQ